MTRERNVGAQRSLPSGELARLTVANNAEALIRLPPPETTDLAKASTEHLFQIAEAYLREIRSLLLGKVTLPTALTPIDNGEDTDDSSPERRAQELWGNVVLTLGSYYDHTVRVLIDRSESKGSDHVVPGLSIPSHKDFSSEIDDLSPQSASEALHRVAALFFVDYQICLSASYVSGLFMGLPTPTPVVAQTAAVALRSLSSMAEYAGILPDGPLRVWAHRLLSTSLIHMAHVNEDEAKRWGSARQLGPFSLLKTRELALLASRDASMVKRHGEKRVERIFERQLALVVQSLGLFVVSTRVGERTVDLICVSPDPLAPMTLLIEAKTSTRPYSLPVKDERALVEYVNDVRRTLTTLPPLRFVLIVGNGPAQTITNKLRKVERDAGVPVRFCAAQLFAELRERLPGPAPLNVFAETVLSSPSVIPAEFPQTVARAYHKVQGAHSEFVKALYASRELPVVMADAPRPAELPTPRPRSARSRRHSN